MSFDKVAYLKMHSRTKTIILWQSEKQINESCEPYISPFENETVLSGCVKNVANKSSEIDETFLRSTVDTFVLNRALDGSSPKPSFTEKSRKWLFFLT